MLRLHGRKATLAACGRSSSYQQHQRRSQSHNHRGDALGYGIEHYTPSDDLVGDGGVWDDGPSGYEWKSRVLTERRGLALDYLTDVKKRVPIHNAVRIRARQNRERLMNDLNNPFEGRVKPEDGKEAGWYEGAEEDAAVNEDRHAAGRRGGGPTLVLNEDSPAAVLTEALRVSHYNPALDLHEPFGSDTAARLAVAAEKDGGVTESMLRSASASASPLSTSESLARGRRAVRDAIDLVEEELEDLIADEGVLETLANIPPEDLKALRDEFYGGAPEVNSAFNDSTDETLRQWLKLRKESSQYHSFMSVPSDERKGWSAWYLRDIRTNKEPEDY